MAEVSKTYDEIMNAPEVMGAHSMSASACKELLDFCAHPHPSFSAEDEATVLRLALRYKQAEHARCRAIAKQVE